LGVSAPVRFILGGDLSVCSFVGCEGDKNVVAGYDFTLPDSQLPSWMQRINNHGRWVRRIYDLSRTSQWNALFSINGVDLGPGLSLSQLQSSETVPEYSTRSLRLLARWVSRNTPYVEYIAIQFYLDDLVQPGINWNHFANYTIAAIDAYDSEQLNIGSSKLLWFDEYGAKRRAPPHSDATQAAYFDGFLGATTCLRPRRSPKFAWVGGVSDFQPYDFSLFESFSFSGNGFGVIPRPSWGTLAFYYRLTQC
jgi:hypothetical protein